MRTIMIPLLSVLLAALIIGQTTSMASTSQVSVSPQIISFGVVPQQSASKLAKLWVPIFQYLGRKTGYKILFKTAPNIPVFEQRLAAGEYDIAYLNPYHYTVFHRLPGYIAFAKQKNKKIQGILVVRKDSRYQDLNELAGETLAFPSPAAFASSVLIRAQFHKQHIPITPKYVTSHDSVYKAVAKGLYPAGGGVVRTFDGMESTVRDQLRILWRTDLFTPHAFAAHPRLGDEVVKNIQAAMLGMNEDAEGRQLLNNIRFNGVETAQDEDWKDVRSLGIKLLNQLAQP